MYLVGETKIIEQYRKKLLNGENVFLHMMQELDMQLATDQLAYISLTGLHRQ